MRTGIDLLWTMPGHLAQSGPLTASVPYLVDNARNSITCSTFNFQRSSGMWEALQRAAARPEVELRVYVDTQAADIDPKPWSPTTAQIAEHLHPDDPPDQYLRRQVRPQPRKVPRHRSPVPARHQRQPLLERRAGQRRIRRPYRQPEHHRSRRARTARRGERPIRGSVRIRTTSVSGQALNDPRSMVRQTQKPRLSSRGQPWPCTDVCAARHRNPTPPPRLTRTTRGRK